MFIIHSYVSLKNEHDTMRDGYQKLQAIEILHQQLQMTNTDDDNRHLTELHRTYYQQLQTYDSNFIDMLRTLRQIQINRTRFEHDCDDVRQAIEQQRQLFQQSLEHNSTMTFEHVQQEIQCLRTIQDEIERKLMSSIDTLRRSTMPTVTIDNRLNVFIDDVKQLQGDVSVGEHTHYSFHCCM
jgi:hypothetical protein